MYVSKIEHVAFRATTAASNGAVFHKTMTACTWAYRKPRKRRQTESKYLARCEARAEAREAAQIRYVGRRPKA